MKIQEAIRIAERAQANMGLPEGVSGKEVAAALMSEIQARQVGFRSLENHELVGAGDKVCTYSTPAGGLRPLQGLIGIPADEYRYDVFREVTP